jgi:hypothetical protein
VPKHINHQEMVGTYPDFLVREPMQHSISENPAITSIANNPEPIPRGRALFACFIASILLDFEIKTQQMPPKSMEKGV